MAPGKRRSAGRGAPSPAAAGEAGAGRALGEVERLLGLAAYAAARAVAGELAALMAAVEVAEGGFRAEAEERWGAPPGSSRRALRTLAGLGYRPGDRRVVELAAEAALAGAEPAWGRCALCGRRLGRGEGTRHALEEHGDAVRRAVLAVAEALGLPEPGEGLLTKLLAPRGAWWLERDGEPAVDGRLVEEAAAALGELLAAARGTAATVTVGKLARLVEARLRGRLKRWERPSRAALWAAAREALESAESVGEWRRSGWWGARAVYVRRGAPPPPPAASASEPS